MKKTLTVLLGVAAVLVPCLALADANDYSYVEGSYLSGEREGLDVNGAGASVSFRLTDQLFLLGKISDISQDDKLFSSNHSEELYQAGAGFVVLENQTGSFYGTVSYIEGRAESSENFSGHDLGIGVRVNLSQEMELKVALNHTELTEGRGGVTMPSAELVYKFLGQLAGVANYSYNTRDSSDYMVGLGLRFYIF